MANPIATIINLNGAWGSGGVPGPLISVSGNAISVDMSAYARPFAAGSVLDSSSITVTFGDDNTYTATLIRGQPRTLDTIRWSNGSTWTRSFFPATGNTLVPLRGRWLSGGTPDPVITIWMSGERSISIYISSPLRPLARGYVLDFADIFVDFPDDNGYTGRLELPNTIRWSNNSTWEKAIPELTLNWQTGDPMTLLIHGNLFTPNDKRIIIHRGHINPYSDLANFIVNTGADGRFTASEFFTTSGSMYAIPCRSGDHIFVSVFETTQATQLSTALITSDTFCP